MYKRCPYCQTEVYVGNHISGDIILCPNCDQEWVIHFIATIVIITDEEEQDNDSDRGV